MKLNFTLFLAMLLTGFFASAAGPTVPSSNLQFPVNNIDGDRLTVSFTKGNGAFRIIVIREGSPVVSAPVNGTDYTANANFGTAGTEYNATDGYVVYRGSSVSTTITQTVLNLHPATTYYVSIFEFNGTGITTEYLLTGLTGSAVTKSAPTGQAGISSFTAVAGNKLTINLSPGNGDRRLIIARKGQPVNAVPQNLTDYSAFSSFGTGSVLNSNNYAVYKGTGNVAAITNLEPNTTYYFTVFEYNGSAGPVYLVPGATASVTTNAGPTQASGTINFLAPVEGNRLTLSFAPGNGKYQLIIVRKALPVTAIPVNGQVYTASTVFGSGQAIAAGEYVMNTINSDRTITNLDPSTTYYFRVYDYDVDANGNTYYLTGSYSETGRSTATTPTVQASNVLLQNVTGTSMTIKHTAGNSDMRLIVMKEGSPVDAIPADLTRYNIASTVFGQGQQITPGNYVMTSGQNTTQLNVTGLTPGSTYYVAVFGFNGSNYPVYATPAATASVTLPNEPTAAGQNFLTNTIEGNSFRAQWTGGNGAGRIVIARKGSAVTALPVDGATYNADANFGSGDEISTGQFVVYNGSLHNISLQALEAASTYHLAVFEYNMVGGVPDYLTSSFLAGNASTASAPTVQTNTLTAFNIQNTQASISFNPGNGDGRLFIMRAGSPVDVTPQDLQSYNSSTTYGSQQIGSGNYVVQKLTNNASFVVTALTPNTQYYVAAFEFNGSSAPIYLSPGVSFSFTTTGSGVIPPTLNAMNPSFPLTDGNKLTFSWDNGDGAKRIVVMRQGSAVAFTPSDATDYIADAAFGNSADLGNGQYVVYNGAQSSVTVTNLLPSITYYFKVFEYNGSGVSTRYLNSGSLTTNKSTATAPASGSTALAGVANNLSLTINWNAGPGNGRIVVIKEGGTVSSLPADLSKYPASNVFGSGAQLGTGEYVVYAGNGNSVTVTGLSAHKTYHYTVFEYNGVDAPVYNTVDAINASTAISSALPVKWLYFNAREENGIIYLDWATAQEYNTSHFIVERSQGNGSFISLATIAAKGGDNRNDYSFTDNSRPAGVVSYRIRQVDTDNRFEYSKQVVIQAIGQQPSLKMYPNPAIGNTRVSLPQGMQQATLKIYSITGVLIKQFIVANGELISLNGVTPGLYQVVITDGSGKFAERLVVR